MKFKFSAIAVAVAAATLSVGAQAAAVDFHGYARSGVGSSTDGGSMVCYRNVGSMNFYRLGNECDTYAELAFDANLAEKGDSKFNIHTMLALGTQQTADWENTAPAFRQMWAEATSIGSGALSTASLWVGKRYYKRQDIHMIDFFYNEIAGPGAGIEAVDVGFAKFSAAYFRNTEQEWGSSIYTAYKDANGVLYADQGVDREKVELKNYATGNYRPDIANGGANTVSNIDLRLEGIQLGGFGAVDVMANIISSNNRTKNDGTETNGDGGYAITGQHTYGVLGGFNRFILQYADGAANLNGSGKLNFTGDYSAFRVMDHLVFDFGAVNGSAVIGYSDTKDGDTDLTIGVRPWYHFNDLYSVGAEYGHIESKPTHGETKKLDKFTVAAQISAGKSFWARPALRAYYTYASWNDALKGSNVACTGRDCEVTAEGFGDKTSGGTYGLQMEAWW
jgi:maltoporin